MGFMWMESSMLRPAEHPVLSLCPDEDSHARLKQNHSGPSLGIDDESKKRIEDLKRRAVACDARHNPWQHLFRAPRAIAPCNYQETSL